MLSLPLRAQWFETTFPKDVLSATAIHLANEEIDDDQDYLPIATNVDSPVIYPFLPGCQ